MLTLSLLFNEEYYLSQNPDVAAAVAAGTLESAFAHFQAFGLSEARDPSAFFSVSYYLEQNPDVAAAGVNALEHFLTFGTSEARKPISGFDLQEYLEMNPDVAQAGVNALEHFLTFGIKELRPNTLVDLQSLAASNADFAAAAAAGDLSRVTQIVTNAVVVNPTGTTTGGTESAGKPAFLTGFTLTDGLDNYSQAGNHDNTFTAKSGTFSENDTLQGLAGNDSLVFKGINTLTDAEFTNKTSIENIVLGNTHNANVILGANAQAMDVSGIDTTLNNTGTVTVDASALTNDITAQLGGGGNNVFSTGSGADTISGAGVGDDNINTGAGLDVIYISNFTSTDSIDGGADGAILNVDLADSDFVGGGNFTNSSNITRVNISKSDSAREGQQQFGSDFQNAGVEVVDASGATGRSFSMGFTSDITAPLEVIGSATLDNHITHVGSGDTTITGGAARDTVQGSTGNDLFTGGGDGDIFFASPGGNDTIVYTSAEDSPADQAISFRGHISGIDNLEGFNFINDRIDIPNPGFVIDMLSSFDEEISRMSSYAELESNGFFQSSFFGAAQNAVIFEVDSGVLETVPNSYYVAIDWNADAQFMLADDMLIYFYNATNPFDLTFI
jgi:Ca2+-binding RTX toxin-like protein